MFNKCDSCEETGEVATGLCYYGREKGRFDSYSPKLLAVEKTTTTTYDILGSGEALICNQCVRKFRRHYSRYLLFWSLLIIASLATIIWYIKVGDEKTLYIIIGCSGIALLIISAIAFYLCNDSYNLSDEEIRDKFAAGLKMAEVLHSIEERDYKDIRVWDRKSYSELSKR